MRLDEEQAWRAQCRAQLQRDVLTRIKYGFCHVHKPVLDDLDGRAFATMSEYREWCARELPAYLGYRPFVAGDSLGHAGK
ncbi:MAG: hypothetical protein ACR2MW_08950 [Chthoniobacterales bacterium]